MTRSTESESLDADVDPAWLEAELHITTEIAELTKWQAEKWAASHERQFTRISLMALRVSTMDDNADRDKAEYLRVAFKRLDEVVASTAWADTTDGDIDRSQAVRETVKAVSDIARHALTAVVLADDGHLRAERTRELALSGRVGDQGSPQALI